MNYSGSICTKKIGKHYKPRLLLHPSLHGQPVMKQLPAPHGADKLHLLLKQGEGEAYRMSPWSFAETKARNSPEEKAARRRHEPAEAMESRSTWQRQTRNPFLSDGKFSVNRSRG